MDKDKLGEVSTLQNRVRALFSSQLLCVLSTYNQGQPYSNLVSFAETSDLKTLIFATNRHTNKYRNAMLNSDVAVLIDSRTNTDSDFHDALAVTAMGKVAEVARDDHDSIKQIFLLKHPYLKVFVNNPDSSLMIVKVQLLIVAGFSEKNIINFNAQI